MPAFDQDGLSRDELEAVRAALARDAALADELELILPALGARARDLFWCEFARSCCRERPAAAVLKALTAAARLEEPSGGEDGARGMTGSSADSGAADRAEETDRR